VDSVRGLGLIAVLELVQNKASREPQEMTDLLGKQGSLVGSTEWPFLVCHNMAYLSQNETDERLEAVEKNTVR
jgi:adenosylmethionine-8-amino-7-oxononanoate aminotransferase